MNIIQIDAASTKDSEAGWVTTKAAGVLKKRFEVIAKLLWVCRAMQTLQTAAFPQMIKMI